MTAVRRSIERRERRALRAWYFQQDPRPSHKECIAWFEGEFHHKLCQSTISESLSDRYSYLDNPLPSFSDTHRRSRPSQWPILERILFEWQQSLQQQGNLPTGDLLIAKANEIWPKIPQYRDRPQPKFSAGWLSKFKARHQIKKKQRRHTEPVCISTLADYNESKNLQPMPSESQGNINMSSTSIEEVPIEDEDTKNIPHEAQTIEYSSNIVKERQPKIPSRGEALSALQTVLLYMQNQQTTQQWELQLLLKVEQELQQAMQDDINQTTLDRWLL